MKIVIADFGAYAFIVQLAGELAKRGHNVLFTCLAEFPGPKGGLKPRDDEPERLKIEPISTGEKFEKYNFLKRRQQERRVGKLFGQQIREFAPDVVMATNMPIDVLSALRSEIGKERIGFVYWLQDIISVAMTDILGKKYGALGRAIGAYYAHREGVLLRTSDAVVAITSDFLDKLAKVGLDPGRTSVLANWAPLDEIPVLPQDNAWAREHGLAGKRVLLYSGTMGLKHCPDVLIETAIKLRDGADCAIVVVSEGLGADLLRAAKTKHGLDNLFLFPFQPAERLPEVLASADVLTVFIEAGAAAYSVPSKLLSYLCAARAVLAAVPQSNSVAKVVTNCDLGIVVAPDDLAGYALAAERLLDDAAARATYGARARQYAEEHFDVSRIADKFEAILEGAARRAR